METKGEGVGLGGERSKKLAQQFDKNQPKIDELWKRKESKDGSQEWWAQMLMFTPHF